MIAKVLVKKLNSKAFIPLYKQPGDAGCDICACLDEPIVLKPGERVLVPTGLAIAIQEGFECQVRTRSGLALKNGIQVLNSPGTIDSGYRGEIGVILLNTTPSHYWDGYHEVPHEPFTIKHGDRIAQLVFSPIATAHFAPADELPDSQRGNGGFGSTGV